MTLILNTIVSANHRRVSFGISANVLRIYEVRLNEIINYKQMLVGVSCIYAVIS